jgi:hypothetical protein
MRLLIALWKWDNLESGSVPDGFQLEHIYLGALLGFDVTEETSQTRPQSLLASVVHHEVSTIRHQRLVRLYSFGCCRKATGAVHSRSTVRWKRQRRSDLG